MFQRLLVPLDGSSRAEQALPVAARLARASGGTVVLLRVVSPPTELLPSTTAGLDTSSQRVDPDFAEATHYLQRVTKMSSLLDIYTETVVSSGQATATILSTVDARQIDLIVLCSHGYTGMKHQVLGSVAEQVAHYAPVPVFLLREGEAESAVFQQHVVDFLRVLVPLDGSVRAKAALVPAAQLIASLTAPEHRALHLLRVVVLPDAEQSSHNEREAIVQKAEQYLTTTVEHIHEELPANSAAGHTFSVTWSVTIDDDIAAGIIRVAEDGEGGEVSGSADMIAMAIYEYPGLQRDATGSVTRRVLQGTRLPLLIVRPQS
ncbi:MAG: universal stress protein [Ktedonobacteraceae bacterium]